ncbi:hypothetical protein BH10CHL1_BH10CHL1_25410 [soil metagenome]
MTTNYRNRELAILKLRIIEYLIYAYVLRLTDYALQQSKGMADAY